MQNCLRDMQQDGGFLQLVDAVQGLVTKQQQELSKIETYLEQYGYTPKPKPLPINTKQEGMN